MAAKSLFLVIVICCSPVFAQDSFVGRILDEHTKEPLPFVNIGIVEKNVGTVSDFSGIFELEVDTAVSASESILFSMIGYETKTISLQEARNNPESLHEITLIEKATALDEVIVTGAR